ncbi:MAG: indolepyruvate oxidoreductase subunit beta [Chlorobiaceae bacterium]|nr:indolepyruvate oxidoreductase subunit beta [Chlorobiaceae bacterium]NTW73264.1 indolepyruvate oxidoreductase subunit beta [Chlorobiaceae bacterium]
MQKNIILAGVGGQGILSIAAVIDWAALQDGLEIRQAEVHGMSQRGGAVQSHLRIADHELYADLIGLGTADLILSVEPLEALRYLPYLAPGGHVVTSLEPFVNMPGYPPLEEIVTRLEGTGHPVLVHAAALAREAGSARASNMVMLGAGAPFTGIAPEKLEAGINALFGAKGQEIIDINIRAFREGLQLSNT